MERWLWEEKEQLERGLLDFAGILPPDRWRLLRPDTDALLGEIQTREAQALEEGDQMATSTLIAEQVWYLPTCIIDDKGVRSKGEHTLIVRRFRITEGPSGKRHLKIDTEAPSFPDASAMGDWIEEQEAKELPAEAEGNPRFVPDEIIGLLASWGEADNKEKT